eukprot:2474442-Karenia_brevis.AAC.1
MRAYSGTHWTCACRTIWYNCPQHLPSTSPARVPQRLKRSTPRTNSAEEARRKLQRLEPNIASRPCLGPILAARFNHLVEETTPVISLT